MTDPFITPYPAPFWYERLLRFICTCAFWFFIATSKEAQNLRTGVDWGRILLIVLFLLAVTVITALSYYGVMSALIAFKVGGIINAVFGFAFWMYEL